ncbi:hypothetical protein GYB22_08305 [bacterium]|nr:hypothetical protein [bacterium]
MNPYIKQALCRLQGYSQSFKKKSIFVDVPWNLVEGDGALQKVIFKRAGSIIVSKSGEAQKGEWEYLHQSKSIFIDVAGTQRLFNEFFLSEGLMVLKLDGTDTMQVFLNGNLIDVPDLQEYLNRVTLDQYGLVVRECIDGRVAIITNPLENLEALALKGSKIEIEGSTTPDGVYRFTNDIIVEAKDSEIVTGYKAEQIEFEAGGKIEIIRDLDAEIQKGDKVNYIDTDETDFELEIDNGITIHISNGVVKKVSKPWFKIF